MKTRTILFLLVLFLLLAGFPAFADEGAAIPFRQIARGSYGGGDIRRYLVVQDEEQWKNLWHEIKGRESEPPRVDFVQNAVVAVFQGEKTSGGYSIAVEAVVEKGNCITIMVREREPGPKSLFTTAFSSPWEVVAITRKEKPVCFESVP